MARGWKGIKSPVQFCPTSGKTMFDKKGATTAANYRYQEDHTALRIYPCPFCRAWHLTSRINQQRKK